MEVQGGGFTLKLVFDSTLKLPPVGERLQFALKPDELQLLPGPK
jgi:hypothetical protein